MDIGNYLDSITQPQAAADNEMSANALIGALKLRRTMDPELVQIAGDIEILAMMFALQNRRIKAVNLITDMTDMIARAAS